MRKNISIVRVPARSIERELLEGCAELYCDIWREHPWNEFFWTVSGVIQDMRKELLRDESIGFWAISNQNEGKKIEGFSWGYFVLKSELQNISGNKKLDFLFQKDSKIFYIDELAVRQELRRFRLGKRLTLSIIASAKDCGATAIILRTDIKAVAARRLYVKTGFKELSVIDRKYLNRTYWILNIGL